MLFNKPKFIIVAAMLGDLVKDMFIELLFKESSEPVLCNSWLFSKFLLHSYEGMNVCSY